MSHRRFREIRSTKAVQFRAIRRHSDDAPTKDQRPLLKRDGLDVINRETDRADDRRNPRAIRRHERRKEQPAKGRFFEDGNGKSCEPAEGLLRRRKNGELSERCELEAYPKTAPTRTGRMLHENWMRQPQAR